jgi:hypothetical protein
MEQCPHYLKWIRRRDDGDFYCTVCRTVLYEQGELFLTEEEDPEIEKQRRIDRLLRE